MCLICEKLNKKEMTPDEARKNIMELRILDHIENNHYYDIIKTISEFQKIEDDKKNIDALKE